MNDECESDTIKESEAEETPELPDAFKFDDDGKIRFNQFEIDYEDSSERKGQFKIMGCGFDARTVGGTIIGKYGVHKDEDTGKYLVTLLQSGIKFGAFDKLSEAKEVASYFNESFSFNDVFYRRGIIESNFYVEKSDAFAEYLQNAKAALENKSYEKRQEVSLEIENGKVPFTTKSGLISYVKNHIGDKVKVTFAQSKSEIRTLKLASNTALKTENADGEINNVELKGVSFNDTGFSIDFGGGNAVTYDFANVSEGVVSSEDTNYEGKGDISNDSSRKTSQDDERHSAREVAETGERIQNSSADGLHRESIEGDDSGGNRFVSKSTGKSETRRLSEISTNENFVDFRSTLLREITKDDYKVLKKVYDNAILDENVSFGDALAYDVITCKAVELSEIFTDQLEEYFIDG